MLGPVAEGARPEEGAEVVVLALALPVVLVLVVVLVGRPPAMPPMALNRRSSC